MMRFNFLAQFLLLFLVGCIKPFEYHCSENPPKIPCTRIPEKIRIALVLGGGGAKGMAHVGVLEEFERAGIPIDIIVGCSVGSLVGALYCDTPNAAYIRTVLEPLKVGSFLDIHIFKAWYGLSEGKAMRRTLDRCLESKTFEEMDIPLLIVASDLHSGELVTIGGGPVIPAVEASSAIPVIYSPVQHYGRMLVDGGVVNPCPVCVAKKLNPDIVVAVELCAVLDHTYPSNLFTMALRSAEVSLLWQSENCIKHADVIIRPELSDIGIFENGKNHYIYEVGRQAAREMIPKIKRLFEERCCKKVENVECKQLEAETVPIETAGTMSCQETLLLKYNQ